MAEPQKVFSRKDFFWLSVFSPFLSINAHSIDTGIIFNLNAGYGLQADLT